MKKTWNREYAFKGICVLLACAAWGILFYAIYVDMEFTTANVLKVLLPLVLATALAFASGWLYEKIPDEIDMLRIRRDRQALWARIESGRIPRELGAIGRPEDADVLFEAIHGHEETVHPNYFYTLGYMKNERALEYLHRLLGSQSMRARDLAVTGLQYQADPRSVEPLAAVLEDPSDRIAQSALEALRRIGEGHAVQPIMKYVEAHLWDWDRRDSVKQALELLRNFKSPAAVRFAKQQEALQQKGKPLSELEREEITQKIALRDQTIEEVVALLDEVRRSMYLDHEGVDSDWSAEERKIEELGRKLYSEAGVFWLKDVYQAARERQANYYLLFLYWRWIDEDVKKWEEQDRLDRLSGKR